MSLSKGVVGVFGHAGADMSRALIPGRESTSPPHTWIPDLGRE